jgi:hypothetical protein
MDSNRKDTLRPRLFWGVAMIVVGALFLAERLGYADIDEIWRFWPALIALHGAFAILLANHLAQAIDGLFSIAVAIWLYACMEHLWGWTFLATWPVIVIAGGVVIVLRGLAGRRSDRNGERAQ